MSRCLALFEAVCTECGATFAQPSLGDFAYGQFLFTGEQGSTYAYLDCFAEPVWAWLEGVWPSPKGRLLLPAAGARFADPIDGQRLVNDHVCPNCQSHRFATWHGQRVGLADVPVASFTEFMACPEEARLRRTVDFFSEYFS